MTDAEIAQTIAEIKEFQNQRHRWRNKDQTLPIKQIDTLLSIVQSLSDKLQSHEKEKRDAVAVSYAEFRKLSEPSKETGKET